MYLTHHFKERLRLFISLFVPLLVYQLANYSASFVDTAMTGQYNTLDLAGVSTATSLWNPFFTFLTGIVSALTPIIGHHLGQGNKKRIASDFYQFIYLSFMMAVLLIAFVLLIAPIVLSKIGLESVVEGIATHYLAFLSLGILPLLLFSVVRSLLDTLGLTCLSMYLMLLLLPLNASFNYILIYGAFGLPELGGAGAGLGTSLAYWVLLIIAFLILFKHPKVAIYQLWKVQPINFKEMKETIRLGLPIGGIVFAEVIIFSLVGLLMAKFPSLTIASHQSAMNFSTLMYAFPVSISSTMAIIVSYELGAGRPEVVKQYCRLGRLTAFGFAIVTLVFLYTFRFQLAGLYGKDPIFVQQTAIFMTYSLFFQVADTFAAPLQGILRGYKDTTVPFLLGVFSYWCISIPLGIFLDHVTNLGPYAYWIGLISSLVVSGICYQLRLWQIEKKQTN